MRNPNDQWRHQQPAPPHAPAHDRGTPGLPVQSPMPGAPTSGDEYSAPNGAVDPYAVNPWLRVAGAAFVFVLSGPIFGSLYPLSTGIALLAGFTTDGILRIEAPILRADGRLPLAMLATVVTFWPMMRLEYRFATTVPAYRRIRHVARVVLIGAYISLATLDQSGGRFFPRSFGQVRQVVADLPHLAVFVAGMIAAHWVLTKATRLRATWEGAMALARLRPAE